MKKDAYEDFTGSTSREINRKEMIELLAKAAYSHTKRVYHFPLLTLYVTEEGIVVHHLGGFGMTVIYWDALLSIRYKPAEADTPGMLTFRMAYGLLTTIVLEANSRDG